MPVRRGFTVLVIAAALTMSFAGSASAGIDLLKGKLTGEGLYSPGAFQAEVKTDKKGRPVKDLTTGRVYITSQNHGYAVEEESLVGKDFVVTHRAVNDGTVEGMKHGKLPIFCVQYHPEAAPGPDDNTYLFDEFLALMQKGV